MIEIPSTNIDVIIRVCERLEGSGQPGVQSLLRHPKYSRMSRVMDLCDADGVNGNEPMDWELLLSADDFNFLHDVLGIHRYMNRETGTIGDCFLPRCTRKPHTERNDHDQE